MFLPFEGGSSIQIQGVEIHLPPVGYVPDYYSGTGELIPSEILFAEEKKWALCFDHDEYIVRAEEEKRLKKSNPDYKDTELEALRVREWKRRLNGVWIFNKDKPIYLTGLYYYYLNYWKFDQDIGYPKFRIPDLEKAYFWQWCVENPKCLGMLEVTIRRFGKTHFGGCIANEYLSRTKRKNGGIQSKTDSDARENVYLNAIIEPMKHLPDFFLPMYDEDKGLTSKSGLSYSITRRKDVDPVWASKTELATNIFIGDSKPKSFDGKKLHRIIHDEVGKLEQHDVYSRHMVLRKCAMDTSTGEYIGKMIATTTVADIEEGGKNFEVYWNNSNQYKIDKKTGETPSGLYRFFMPAYRTMYFDEYGYPNEERARIELNNKLASLTGSPKAYNHERRESPMSESDLFASDANMCPFNVMIIDQTINFIEQLPDGALEMPRLFDMVWKVSPEQGTPSVELIPNPINGRWSFSYIPPADQLNKIIDGGSIDRRFKADNNDLFAIGTDPVSMGAEALSGRSSAAIAVYMKDSPWKKEEYARGDGHLYFDNFIADYLHDPDDPEEYYDDCLKACIFFGSEVLIEKNKFDIYQYFKRKGALNLIMERPSNTFNPGKEKEEEGINASVDTITVYINRLQTFFDKRGIYCRQLRILKDARSFNYKNRGSRDLTVAAGWCIIAAQKPYKPKVQNINIKKALGNRWR
jgi:hypothetical protein